MDRTEPEEGAVPGIEVPAGDPEGEGPTGLETHQ